MHKSSILALTKPNQMKTTIEWLNELPAPYNELALQVLNKQWENYKDISISLPDAIARMCDWESTGQYAFWAQLHLWAIDPNCYKLPLDCQNEDWQVDLD